MENEISGFGGFAEWCAECCAEMRFKVFFTRTFSPGKLGYP